MVKHNILWLTAVYSLHSCFERNGWVSLISVKYHDRKLQVSRFKLMDLDFENPRGDKDEQDITECSYNWSDQTWLRLFKKYQNLSQFYKPYTGFSKYVLLLVTLISDDSSSSTETLPGFKMTAVRLVVTLANCVYNCIILLLKWI